MIPKRTPPPLPARSKRIILKLWKLRSSSDDSHVSLRANASQSSLLIKYLNESIFGIRLRQFHCNTEIFSFSSQDAIDSCIKGNDLCNEGATRSNSLQSRTNQRKKHVNKLLPMIVESEKVEKQIK